MFKHIPVMLKEAIEALNVDKNGIYVDATIGGGGHSEKILNIISQGIGKLVGIDQDIDAISNIKEKFKYFIDNGKLVLVKNNFENIKKILYENNIKTIDGILFDLGVSSYQFDEESRGFSYRSDAKLDMRMNKENLFDCWQLVNTFEEKEIYQIIRDYGEDKFAKNIAKHIVAERKKKTIDTTFELVEVIKSAIPAKMRWGNGNEKNPAKRTFQAFRIYVNRELEVIKEALDEVVDCINVGGRIVVITFHSIEDKLVKDKFKEFENPCICPKGYPCVCGKKSKGKMINKKVIVATDEELENNRRAKSAKLRIFEKE